MEEGRKYLTGRRWELIGYSWRQNIVTGKWDAMRVFGDGSSDPAEIESYETRDEAHTAAEKLAMKKNVPVFPPEHPKFVFYEPAESSSKASPEVAAKIGEQVEFEWDIGIPGEPITKASGEVMRIEDGMLYVKIKESSTPLFIIGAQYIIPEEYVVGRK